MGPVKQIIRELAVMRHRCDEIHVANVWASLNEVDKLVVRVMERDLRCALDRAFSAIVRHVLWLQLLHSFLGILLEVDLNAQAIQCSQSQYAFSAVFWGHRCCCRS